MSKIAALGLVAALAFTGCGRTESNPSDGGTKTASDNTVCKDAKGDTKVGLAFDVGGVGDQSFNDSAYAGLKKAVAELGVGCTTGEATQDEAESAREDRLRTMADAGMVAGLWAEKFDQIAAFQNFIVMPMTFLSGVFYSIASLPPFWQGLSHLNPFFYVIDGFRRGFFGISDVSPWLSLAVVSATLLAVCALNVQLLRSGYKIRG